MILVNSIRIIENMPLWDYSNNRIVKFLLWPAQKIVLTLLSTFRFIILLKTRQCGMTQLIAADSLVQCMFLENFVVLLLSVSKDDADEILLRIRNMYKGLDDKLKPADNPVVKGLNGGDDIVFKSGSRLISLPAIKGRGRTGNRVFIDEAAFINPKMANTTLDEVLKSITSVVEKAGGQLIISSTANGMGKFRDIFVNATRGVLKGFKAHFFGCFDDPTFTEADRQEIVDKFGEDHANQEKPRTPEEAFLSSGRPRFDRKSLAYYEKKIKEPIVIGDITNNGPEQNDKGSVKFYQKKKKFGQYCIFADVAEGLEHSDNSVAKVFDLETWEQVAEWAGHCEPAEFGTILHYLGKHYNNAYIAPEANNHGHATIVQLKNVEEYPVELIFESNYIKEKADDDFKHPDRRYGWITSSTTKKLIIDNLAQMIVQKQVKYFTKEDIEELYTYIRDKKGGTNAESGCFDDRVMCSAIAYYLLKFYELKKFLEYQKCINCEHHSSGECHLTGRKVVDSDLCVLYCEIYFEIDDAVIDKAQKLLYNSSGGHTR